MKPVCFALPGRGFPEILPCDDLLTNMPVYGQARIRNKERPAYVRYVVCVKKTETRMCLCNGFSLGAAVSQLLW